MDIKIIGLVSAAAILCYRLYSAYKSYVEQRNLRMEKGKSALSKLKGIVGFPQKYTLELPVQMEKVTDLNDTASLQLQNEDLELYAIVIDESSEEFKTIQQKYGAYEDGFSLLENYKRIQLASFQHEMKIEHEEELQMGLPSLRTEGLQFDARLAGISFPISYYTLFVEDKEDLYFIVAWTPIGMKDENKPHILSLLRSFRPQHY